MRRFGVLAGALLATVVVAACAGPLPIPEPDPTPRTVMVTVTDAASGMPISGARMTSDDGSGTTDAEGAAVVTALAGSELEVEADGFDPATGTVPEDGDLAVELRNNTVRGTVRDEAGQPIAGVRVFVEGSGTGVRTATDGTYALPGVPASGTLIYKASGYRLGRIPVDAEMTKDVTLPTFVARALYAPAAVFEGAGRLDAMLALLDQTEANAMVIDVKETGGWLYYETDLPEAVEAGSLMANPVLNLEELLPALHERGIYTIARVVVMKDNTLGRSQPDLAVRNTQTGEPWTDWSGGVWLDPGNPGVAEYVASIAGDLAAKGFDEVQLDYIRFYSDGPYELAETNLPHTQSFRLPTIQRVMRVISGELEWTPTFLAADVFPIAFIASDDQGIGQRPEVIMPYVDYFSPMVYPSHFYPGVFDIAEPNEHPYEMIDGALEIMNAQAAGLPMRIRPWIQDFGYGGFRAYTAPDVRAEMQAVADNNGAGWMIWNASAIFTEDALGPAADGEAYAPVTAADAGPAPSAPAPGSAPPSGAPSGSP
ncbi:MAG TPA: putative glycoside hydrolase [Candidatus Limnocylindria bacterium]